MVKVKILKRRTIGPQTVHAGKVYQAKHFPSSGCLLILGVLLGPKEQDGLQIL